MRSSHAADLDGAASEIAAQSRAVLYAVNIHQSTVHLLFKLKDKTHFQQLEILQTHINKMSIQPVPDPPWIGGPDDDVEPSDEAVKAWKYYEQNRREKDDLNNIEHMEILITMIRRNALPD